MNSCSGGSLKLTYPACSDAIFSGMKTWNRRSVQPRFSTLAPQKGANNLQQPGMNAERRQVRSSSPLKKTPAFR
jgi:hypothetical protein